MFYNTEGSSNTALGHSALYNNTTASFNTAVGMDALETNTQGENNTALGYQAGDIITTGNNNVMLGNGSDPSANTGSNQIVIGSGATGHGDNIAVVGNGSTIAIHPSDDNEVDLGSSNYSYKDLFVDGTSYLSALNMSVNSTITSNTTFNGTATIIPVNTGNGPIIITIDSDQKVAGRILIFKQIAGAGKILTIATEGSEQIQGRSEDLADAYQITTSYQTVHLFCDGSNWYDISGS